MIKVKEYLDKNFYQCEKCSAEIKKNGHYKVFGTWEYPKGISQSERERFNNEAKFDPQMKNWIAKNQMIFSINNETLFIKAIIINNEAVSKYGYLQTYEHIPRVGPDINGYYARSTDEEIIKYIDEFYQKINITDTRKRKLEKLSKML